MEGFDCFQKFPPLWVWALEGRKWDFTTTLQLYVTSLMYDAQTDFSCLLTRADRFSSFLPGLFALKMGLLLHYLEGREEFQGCFFSAGLMFLFPQNDFVLTSHFQSMVSSTSKTISWILTFSLFCTFAPLCPSLCLVSPWCLAFHLFVLNLIFIAFILLFFTF